MGVMTEVLRNETCHQICPDLPVMLVQDAHLPVVLIILSQVDHIGNFELNVSAIRASRSGAGTYSCVLAKGID